jgi:SnoaL-like domain
VPIDNVEELIDRENIREVLLRLARASDRQLFELRRDSYHPDAVDNHGVVNGPVADYFRFAETTGASRHRVTQHYVVNSLIELNGDRARAETYFLAPHAIVDPDGHLYFVIMAGRYFDELERRAGTWRISCRQILMDWHLNLRDDSSCPPYEGIEDFISGIRGHSDMTVRSGFVTGFVPDPACDDVAATQPVHLDQ